VIGGRAALAALAVVLVACGDGGSSNLATDGGAGDPGELAGYRRDPAPVVGDFELPDLSNDGEPFALRAEPGELLVVYFGYTNCPDFCPTTLSDVRLARRELDEPSAVDVAMITIDPDRDLPILAEYMDGFFPDDGHALGTDDPSLLARVAAPFGTSYLVSTNDDGDVEVGHRTDLYAVDDEGSIALTWPFGVSKDELAADFEHLLDGDT
jgi:protein SCO1/2